MEANTNYEEVRATSAQLHELWALTDALDDACCYVQAASVERNAEALFMRMASANSARLAG